MTRNDIIEMARESDLEAMWDLTSRFVDRLERFAALVAAAERQACAAMVEPVDESLADEIRARREK